MSHRPFLQRVLGWSGPLLLLLCLALKMAEWHTDWLWFEAASYRAQFTHLMAWRAGAFAAGGAFFALWLGANAHLAWRNAARGGFSLSFFEGREAPGFIPLEDRLRFDGFRRRATVFTVALLSWLVGLGCATRYTTFLRAYYGQGMGQFDLASGYDLGFFLFQLPLWRFLSRFCLLGLVCALVVVLAIYLYEETLGLTQHRPLVAQASRHLAVLWAALLLWRGVACLLSIPEGFVNGGNVATRVFDAVDIRLGWTSSLVFAFSAPLWALFSGLAIARRPRPITFLLGVGWFVAAGNLPVLLPLLTGHGAQDPQWREALNRHLNSTRRAWSLDTIKRRSLMLPNGAAFGEASALGASSGVASPSPLAIWPPETARAAMNHDLKSRNVSQRVPQVWLERAAGSLQYVGVASPVAPPTERDWLARHLGSAQGEVLRIDATRADKAGGAVFAPPTPLQFLFGPDERSSGSQNDPNIAPNPVWTLAKPAQADFRGVALTNPLTRLAVATRFLDWNLLRASKGDYKLLWHRGAAARCAQIAPFLDWPAADARPLVLETSSSRRRLVWLVPGLVWSDDFPDSATPAATGTAPQGANYGRQAALGVVDGLSGEVTLVSLDEYEPYLALYRRAFPGLFAPLTSLSNPIRAALRPAATLLSAQALIWTRYHETDALSWAAQRNNWRFLWPALPGEVSAFGALAEENPRAASPQWLVLPLASAVGQAGAPGATSPLTALLCADESNFAARHGQVRWTQWQAPTPISLPVSVTQPVEIRGSERLNLSPSALFSVAPRFDGAGRIEGLWVARSEPLASQASSTSTGGPAAIGAPRLTARRWLAGRDSRIQIGESQGAAASRKNGMRWLEALPTSQLSAARSAWRDLQLARRKGDWGSVARAEKRLGDALREP